MTTILVADDNPQITNVLERYLLAEGYCVLIARDGEAAISIFNKHNVDVVLLDVMMPKVDGFEVCRTIRRRSDVPILMITARSEDFERIMGLDIGADDYIVKPFSPGEVLARIRAVLRRLVPRGQTVDTNMLTYDDLSVDLDSYTVRIGNEDVPMTKRAVEILYLLLSQPGRIFTRETLLDTLWGKDYYGDIRCVDSQIKRMRSLLGAYSHPRWDIKTVRGVGYTFEKE